MPPTMNVLSQSTRLHIVPNPYIDWLLFFYVSK